MEEYIFQLGLSARDVLFLEEVLEGKPIMNAARVYENGPYDPDTRGQRIISLLERVKKLADGKK